MLKQKELLRLPNPTLATSTLPHLEPVATKVESRLPHHLYKQVAAYKEHSNTFSKGTNKEYATYPTKVHHRTKRRQFTSPSPEVKVT